MTTDRIEITPKFISNNSQLEKIKKYIKKVEIEKNESEARKVFYLHIDLYSILKSIYINVV